MNHAPFPPIHGRRAHRARPVALPALLVALLAASAQARFGYEPSDPVRTEDVAGEYAFAARLRDANGAPVTARRTGSSFVEGFAMPMDRWTVGVGTNEVVLWIYAYGPTNSLAAPEGFSLADPPASATASAAPAPTAENEASPAPALPPAAPGEWPGLDDEAALAAWSESVRANKTLFTSARFRDEMLLPLLRREALEPLLAGPDKNKPWFAEARAYAEDALHRCWFLSMTDRPGPEWGRAYDFTVREGSSDPFLSWMSVVGQHKWHWDAQARPQLDELERRASGPSGTPFQRFLAAHARQAVDPSDAHLAALYAAAAAWAASCRPAESRAVRQILVQFLGTPGPAFRAALAAAGADPWIALIFEGSAELDRRTAAGADKAAEALEKAHALHPDFPEAAALLITVALRRGSAPDADLWFRRALAAQIDHRTVWAAYCRFNHPCTLGTPDRLVRLAEAALATKRDDIGLPLEYARAMAAVRHDTGAEDKAFWCDPDVAAKMEAALDPAIANTNLHAEARAIAIDMLSGVRLLRGDLDGALEAFRRAPVPVWSYDASLAFSDVYRISETIGGLTGPNAERITPLYRKHAAGDWAACAAEADALPPATHLEAGLLAMIAADAWMHVGYPAGQPRYFGVLRKRQFCDWINYGSGLTLEEGTDDGSGHTKDGDAHWMRLETAVPAELTASGRFEPWGAPDAPHVLGVQLGAHLYRSSRTRLVAFVREKERVGAALVDDPSSWDAATPVEPSVWRRLPEGWPARWRIVYAAGRLLVFLGDDDRPCIDAPLAADGADAPPSGPCGLWFGHRNIRFFGVTLRKPDADETALAAESAANARAEAAEEEARAKSAGASVLSAETPLADVVARAEAGDAAAQYELGFRYRGGTDGVERDLDKAAAWVRKAADQGMPYAWFALGELYARPDFAGRDFAEAKKWYLKAAESEDARIRSYARNSLGTSYEYGTLGPLVERDLDAAERWYRKALESWTNAVAERNLGCLFASGKDRYLDDGKAVRRLFASATKGDADAQDRCVSTVLLCGEFGMPLTPDATNAWARYCRDWEEHWRTSGGDPYDEWIDFAFGALRERGVFLEKDAAMAVEWYRKSAEHGLPRAQLRLAELHWTGAGADKDERAALDWIRKAAADGSEKAKELLALHETGDRPAFETALLALRPRSWEELKKATKRTPPATPSPAEEPHAEFAEPGGGSGEAQPPPVEPRAESAENAD